jgi:Asp-tRNA(Asn)/Glu-tRNA(Gln) amidotransferase A subunit family amidase
MKPTFGRLSTDGTIPLAPSLDHMGHFARSAADLDIVYRCMTASGTEGISGNETVFDPDGFPASLRVGLLDGWFRQGARPEALAATEQIASAFTNVHLVELPEADRARSAAYCITAAEAGRIHLTNLRDRAGDFDHACRDRLIAGALLPTNLLVQALRFQQWFRSRVAELIDGFDLLLAPATPCSAPRIGQVTIDIGGVQVPARANLGIYTQPLSFVGLPIITLPVHQPGAMPLGVQLIGKPWTESLLLAVTCELERRGIATSKPFGPSSK